MDCLDRWRFGFSMAFAAWPVMRLVGFGVWGFLFGKHLSVEQACLYVAPFSVLSYSPGYTRFKDCGCKTNRVLILSVASSTVGILHGKFNHSAILDR